MYTATRGGGESMRARFGMMRTRRSKMPYGGARGLGVGALTLLGTISLLIFLRRRAKRNGSSTEEIIEHPKPREDEGRPEREQASGEGRSEYFRKLIEETNKRSRSSSQNREARGRPAREQEREVRMGRDDERAGRREPGSQDHVRDE